ncbi:methylaspartate mutase [Saccharothrix longispora]|uniref:methylaspartate mutase n=1 Tax=Saccharothrix longispora TaxID=33920 RepID=UPI0028FD98D9|nr:methylaspartate mutase [Saccharothrix longispora]MDU0293224.1 methylaspartate mutase [Saccharothrix longispora]
MADPGDVSEVILGVTESDAHAVANKIIELRLAGLGYRVANLGPCTSLDDFAEEFARRPDAVAVVIGGVNGHMCEDLRDLPALRAIGRLACPVVVGGNLAVNPGARPSAKRTLLGLGVDHVLDDLAELAPLLHALAGRRAPRESGSRV